MQHRISFIIGGLLLATAVCAVTAGWSKDKERDFLTGKSVDFVHGFSGAGEGLRVLDLLRSTDGQFQLRFVVPQIGSTVFEHSPGQSVVRSPEELGDGFLGQLTRSRLTRSSPSSRARSRST